MGRPERPLDPEAGPVQRLAHELRALRRAAGGPSYREMAREAGFSATTLSQAAAGERLPSLAVLQGYVRACGGDPGDWEPRWKEAETAVAVSGDGDDGAPYRGLARFEPGDRHLFFGRDRMIEELSRLVADHRLAVLFGASGSGKSSLLRAGMIPRIREEITRLGGTAVLRVFTPGERPAQTYGRLLAPSAAAGPVGWVVVDQFEEVFTLCRDRAERARFIDLLLAARDPGNRLRVLLIVRADFYARCAEHRALADALSGAGMLLGPMTADELREAVVRPAQAAGLLVERELTARIVEDVLDQPGALPMLSHALLETWRRRKGRMLTLAGYEAAGGVRGAIAATADQVYDALSPARAETAR
ncbi:helix-turn-helix domain-containing protein, partial [Streptomyces sp. ID05-47C]|uniref:nSTAND1 domain-containing NTPase n=1 Tax=Streptomyces sp. ID05-47C TaxID=3028665 RepID=UPI0029B1F947